MALSHVSLHPPCPTASHLAQKGMGPLWESRGRGRRYLRQPPGRWPVPRRAPCGRTSLRVRPPWASFPSGAFLRGPEIRNSVSRVSPHTGQGQQYHGAAWSGAGWFPGLSPSRAITAKCFLCQCSLATCAKHGHLMWPRPPASPQIMGLLSLCLWPQPFPVTSFSVPPRPSALHSALVPTSPLCLMLVLLAVVPLPCGLGAPGRDALVSEHWSCSPGCLAGMLRSQLQSQHPRGAGW